MFQKYRKLRDNDVKYQAILDEIGKQIGLKITVRPRRHSHKAILGTVGDLVGLGKERMKQIAPSGVAKRNKIMKRLARDRKPDTE